MAVTWIEHRFAGGVLALDVANTVVLRIDPDRAFDRFADMAELPRFAAAASRFRTEELGGQMLVTTGAQAEGDRLTRLRETIDALFRDAAADGGLDAERLSRMLAQCAAGLAGAGGATLEGSPGGRIGFAPATALSAISLLAPERWRRIRVCANCGWLFFDRSKNGSRRWCDMAVCGNRSKARRFYARSREAGDG